MVAPGSLHWSGRFYEWVTDFPWKDIEDLPFAPEWALAEIRSRWDEKGGLPEIAIAASPAPVRSDLVFGTLEEWWSGRKARTLEDGRVDRSLTLFTIGHLLAKRGASPEEIVSALRDCDEAFGFYKYSRRRDRGQNNIPA